MGARYVINTMLTLNGYLGREPNAVDVSFDNILDVRVPIDMLSDHII